MIVILTSLLFQCDFVRALEQCNRSVHVRFFTQVKTDPACLGQNVMRPGFFCGYDLITDLFGEGNIHKRVAVDVTDLAFADAKFRAAEAVWMGFDALPGK